MNLFIKNKMPLLFLVFATLLTYIFYHAWPIKDATHHQVVDNFISLEKNQMKVKQILLQVSLNQNSNFDKLTYLQKRQEYLTDYIKSNIPIILGDRSSFLQSRLEKYTKSQNQESILIRDFIRSSAILKNSISYYIYLGRDFYNHLISNVNTQKQATVVKQIISDSLIFDPSLKKEMDISNGNALVLTEILSELNIPKESNFTFLPKHLEKITLHKQLMEGNMKKILSDHSDEEVTRLFKSYLDEFEALEKEKRVYAYLSIFIITLLVIFIAYYVFSLKKEKGDLLEEVSMLSTAMEQSQDAVMMFSADKNIEYVNPAFIKITGYDVKEILGNLDEFIRSQEETPEAYDEIWNKVKNGDTWRGELRKRRKSGALYWAAESVSPIFDNDGVVTHFLSTHRDITEQYVLNEQVTFDASHDALTGLVNRREFEQRAEQLLISVQKDKEQHALCFMDLDQFKVVNDTCGHAAGDELLRQLSLALMDAMRPSDTLARLGGDEFGVILANCSLENAHNVAKQLQKVIQDYQFSWEGHNFKVGVSMGLIAITETMASLSELLKNADTSCYMAKELGRNRIHVYSENDTDIVERQNQMQWVERINTSLEKDQFTLYAQAIEPLDGSTNTHYELLIRMLDAEDNIIPPGAFLPAAERYNLIVSLDKWVVRNAFKSLLEHPQFFSQVTLISINISGASLAAPEFIDFVYNEFVKTKLPPEKFCFEITETAAISNLSTATLFISEMKALGCKFALDDFGSGLSSFGYLKTLPVDYLKIDGMFVKDIVDDPIDRAMVKSINEIGHVMGMKTIAEFVENDVIKGMLKEIGINYAQGYGIGKPMSLDALLKGSSNVINIKQKKAS